MAQWIFRSSPSQVAAPSRDRGWGPTLESHLRGALVLFLAVWLLPTASSVRAQTPDDTGRPAPAPLTPGQVHHGSLLLTTGQGGLYEAADGLETDVLIRVTGFISRTVVRQRFKNSGDQWREGIYVFPLPEGAAVDAMRLVIGERVIEGEIQERAKAKKIYEQAKQQGKKASLVEQERPNMFTTSVANIGPEETVDVVIEYQQDLGYDGGLFQLRFPMVVNPRYIAGTSSGGYRPGESTETLRAAGHGWAEPTNEVPDADRITPPVSDGVVGEEGEAEMLNPVNLSVELDAGLPVADIRSLSHALNVTPEGEGRYLVELADGWVPADRDFVLEWRPERGHEPKAAAFVEHHDGADYLLLMLMPPRQSPDTRRIARETIFVVDRSGSMSGAPMEQAKEALTYALDRLPAEDHFNIITFSSGATKLFEQSVPADAAHLGVARRHVSGIDADGGTEMADALRLALKDQSTDLGLRQVIFITDGSVGNEGALFAQIRRNLDRSRLFTVGIGSAPNGHFMRKAADFGGGTFTFIGDPREVSTKMTELFSKIEHPVLRDLQLHWADPTVETWPERPGDLYLGEPLVVAARSENGFGDLLLEGRLGESLWQRNLTLEPGPQRQGVHKLWARKKIASLMDSLVTGADGDSVRQEVVSLGLGHHLVTRHTSLVAVDKTPSRPADEALKSQAVQVNRPAGVTLPQGGTGARLWMLLGALLLALAAWSGRRAS